MTMIQAFEAPWPIIQANAIYFSSSILCLCDDQHILSLFYTQVILRYFYLQLSVIVKRIILNEKYLYSGVWIVGGEAESVSRCNC